MAAAKSSGVSTSVSNVTGRSTYIASCLCAWTTALPHPSPVHASSSPNSTRRNKSGGAVTSPYRDTTSGASVPRAAATSIASVSALTRTMSPSITTAASTSGPSAFKPWCREPLVGPVKSGLTANTTERSFSSVRSRSPSWPMTTTTGESPAARARRAARRISDSPSSWSSILFWPMRREAPAARITPATRRVSVGRGMDRRLALAQRAGTPAGAHREDLGNHRQRHLLRPVGADVETDGPVHETLVHGRRSSDVLEDALGALARPEHADVGDGSGHERPEIRLVVGEVVGHDDGVARCVERQRAREPVALALHEQRRRREALPGEIPGPPIHHDHPEAHVRREARERPGVVPRAEDHKLGRRLEHVDEHRAPGDLVDPGLVAAEQLARPRRRSAIHVDRAEVPFSRVARDDQPLAPSPFPLPRQ